MAYTPRPWTWHTCPHCQVEFAARNTRRRYCSHSCNVRASYARTGRRGAALNQVPLPTRDVLPVPILPPSAAAATPPRPATRATQVIAFCHALQQTLARTKAEQAARSQFVDRLLQAYAPVPAPAPPEPARPLS